MVSIGDLFPFDNELGYLSILLISFVGSIVVFIPIPYAPVLLAAAISEAKTVSSSVRQFSRPAVFTS